ncbi:MAG: hypothetical protein DI598_01805 [Pseudopedobacter saltans]|uniref:GLPGLI family protein n=1 Tax=Pseudopedobacter saltans TaxID=151895 RepID=A0A2W5F7G9_9SPHI|nr:MAG: hypothetical protein DI598_01805 [Pseudopedobacter saltans]
MRKVIGLLAMLIFSFTSNAQYNMDYIANLKQVGGKYQIKSPEKTIGVVVYQQIFKPDSTKLDSVQIDTMALSYSQHFSDYRLNALRRLDSTVSNIIDRKSKEDPSAKNTEPFPKYDYRLSKTRFLSDANNVYGYETLIENEYLLKYITKKINWDISDSTKEVCGFTCQKATADILGRHYTAWFTTDIPASFGPRTLIGLPGIILLAYDNTREIYYTAINIFQSNETATIGLPTNAVVCTKKEFGNMLEAFETNPSAFLSSQKNVVVGVGSAVRGAKQSNKPAKKESKNAIELEMEK